MTCPQRNPISPGVAALRWSGSFRLDEVAGFLRIARQLCTGLGGRNHRNTQSAKLVLEMTPKWFRNFWLCDISPAGIEKLRTLEAEHVSRKRRVTILEGDFNEKVYEVLNSGQIKEKTATFALLDQRTFECKWQTVKALSEYKSGNKIEIFYFFPTGWIDRSLAAVSKSETKRKVEEWWGRADWDTLRGMDGIARALMVAKRFEEELGFGKAAPFPIHSDRRGGRVMYHMIHATDHPEAFPLMFRAYRNVYGSPELEDKELQLDLGFEDLLYNISA